MFPIIPADTLLLFFGTALALALAPGPDNIFVLTQSILYGRQAGFWVTLGLCTGLLVHTAAVALGIAVIFQTTPWAFNALKIAGAIYLLYLAWQVFRAPASSMTTAQAPALSPRNLYLRGIVMNITNPKVALFFLAFLPQFASPDRGSLAPQIAVLGALFMLATLIVFGSIAWAASSIGQRLKESPGAQSAINYISGVVFVGLAVRLAFSR